MHAKRDNQIGRYLFDSLYSDVIRHFSLSTDCRLCSAKSTQMSSRFAKEKPIKQHKFIHMRMKMGAFQKKHNNHNRFHRRIVAV